MKKILAILSASIFVFASHALAFKDRLPRLFKAGETVCFIGDSIAHGGFYSDNIALFYATRYPSTQPKFRNAGMSGQGVGQVLARLDWDVYKRYSPEIVVLMIGMNDSPRAMFADDKRGTPAYERAIKNFHKNYPMNLEKTIKSLSENTKKLIVFTPSIFDQTVQSPKQNLFGCNDSLGWAGGICKDLAKKYNAELVDIWTYMTDKNALYQKSDPTRSFIDRDRVHPRDLGGFVMMTKAISDWEIETLVSCTEIDAGNGNVKTENAILRDLKIKPSEMNFTLFEASLPFPTTAEKDDADKVLGFLDKYNKQILKVTNLQDGDYVLKIDGDYIARFNAHALSNGVNLAKFKNTPQYKQAQEVEKLSHKWRQAAADHRNLIGVEIWVLKNKKFPSPEDYYAEIKRKLDANEIKYIGDINWCKAYLKNKPKEAELIKAYEDAFCEIYKAAYPKPHKFSLKKVEP